MAIIDIGLFQTRGEVTLVGDEETLEVTVAGPSNGAFLAKVAPGWNTTVEYLYDDFTSTTFKVRFGTLPPAGAKLRWEISFY